MHRVRFPIEQKSISTTLVFTRERVLFLIKKEKKKEIEKKSVLLIDSIEILANAIQTIWGKNK